MDNDNSDQIIPWGFEYIGLDEDIRKEEKKKGMEKSSW